jgi:hypothetical protein
MAAAAGSPPDAGGDSEHEQHQEADWDAQDEGVTVLAASLVPEHEEDRKRDNQDDVGPAAGNQAIPAI